MPKKKSKRSAGIDPSLTGLAGVRSDGESYEGGLDKIGDNVHDRRKRLDAIIDPFIDWLIPFDPETIVLEGYFGQMRATTLRLIELGWQLRMELSLTFPTAEIVEVAPSSMKKIITGDGTASKTKLATTLAVAHGIVLPTDNVADALGFLQIARMINGEVKPTDEQRAALKKANLL